MPFVSDTEPGDEGYGMALIQSDLMDGYIEPEPPVAEPIASSPGAGPTVVGFDNDSGGMDINPSDPIAPMDMDDDEEELESLPVTTQKKRGRPSLSSRSASATPARTTVIKTPKSGKSTGASKASSGRKRKAAELEEDGLDKVEEPPTKKGGRPTRTTGVVASARLAARAAKKPTRGRPKSAATATAKAGRRAEEDAAVDGVPEGEYEVEAIVESAIDADSMEHMYLVKWKGYPEDQNTWEPRKNLDHAAALIKAFDAKPKKPEAKAAKKAATKAKAKPAAASKAAPVPKEKKKPGRKPGRPPGRPKKATKT